MVGFGNADAVVFDFYSDGFFFGWLDGISRVWYNLGRFGMLSKTSRLLGFSGWIMAGFLFWLGRLGVSGFISEGLVGGVNQ